MSKAYSYNKEDILSLVFDEDYGPYGEGTAKGWLVVLDEGSGYTTTYPVSKVPTEHLEYYQSKLIAQLSVVNEQLNNRS